MSETDSCKDETDSRKPFVINYLGRMTCINCNSNRIQPIFLIIREGVYHGEEGHGITYSHVVIVKCESCGCGQIEEMEHDCFDWEDNWDEYDWYHITKEDIVLLSQEIERCKEPLNERCKCEIHLQLRKAIARIPRLAWKAVMGERERVHNIVVLKNEKIVFEVVKKENAKKN